MPSSVRSKDKEPASKAHLQAPMSERQQMALLMQMTSTNEPKSPGGTSYSSRHRDRNERGETQLHLAAIKGDLEQVTKLLSHKADPNVADFAGWTPLHEACNYGYFEIATKLVQAGANVNAKGLDNDTPLHDAVINGHFEIIKLLVEHGADINAKNAKGKSPLEIASPLVKPHVLNPSLPIPESAAPSRQPTRGRDDKKVTEGSKNKPTASNSEENSEPNKPEDVYEFKSKESAECKATEAEAGTENSGATCQTAEESAKRNISEVTENEETTNEDESRKKKRKEESGAKEKPAPRSSAQNKSAGGGGKVNSATKSANLTANSKSTASTEKKSPVPSPKNDEAEDDSKPDLKVPPLKIVIPQTNEAESSTGTARSSKNSSQRTHQALPYVVPISSEGSEEKPDENAPSTNSCDDKKDGGATAGNNEEQSATATSQQTQNQRGGRVLRSSNRGQTEQQQQSQVVAAQSATTTNCSATCSTSTVSPSTAAPSSSDALPPSTTINPIPSAAAAPSVGSIAGTINEANQNHVVLTAKIADSQGAAESSEATSTSVATSTSSAVTTTAVSGSTSSASTTSAAPPTPQVELHPRKRKMKPNKEPVAPPADPPDALSAESQVHPHEQPITNCYQLFLDIRKQIEKRRKGLFPVQPKPPQGFKDYLMNRCTYVLAGTTSTTPNISYPPNLPAPMRDLFTEQEKERYRLRMQHVIEKEKLVLSVEQEILRVHGRAARALANQSLPFSVCSILRDEEVYNLITPEQEEKDRNARSRYNGRLFLSWLQDVDDKWEKIKEHMLLRHHNEAESLHAVQKMNWEWKMKEMSLCDRKSTPSIDEHHVPMVHVSDDFDLLPA